MEAWIREQRDLERDHRKPVINRRKHCDLHNAKNTPATYIKINMPGVFCVEKHFIELAMAVLMLVCFIFCHGKRQKLQADL